MASSSATCIPHCGSRTSRLPVGSPVFSALPSSGCDACICELNKRLRSQTPHESKSVQNKNRKMRAKKPIGLRPVRSEHPEKDGEASVCKGKRARQTKMCDFNRLRGGLGKAGPHELPPNFS